MADCAEAMSVAEQAVGAVAGGTTAPTVAAEAHGWKLHLSSRSRTGYRGVYRKAEDRYQAECSADGKNKHLGHFPTAVDAAVAYAKHMAGRGASRSCSWVQCDEW